MRPILGSQPGPLMMGIASSGFAVSVAVVISVRVAPVSVSILMELDVLVTIFVSTLVLETTVVAKQVDVRVIFVVRPGIVTVDTRTPMQEQADLYWFVLQDLPA